MQDIKNYYENTKNAMPHSIVKKFIAMHIKPRNAIDLGCGAGRDTVYLIRNGWKVLAIDKENTSKIISSNLNEEEKKSLSFQCQNFENIVLERNNLLVANFSLPFCDKKYFMKFWNKIVSSIIEDGYFVGNFLGTNDSWANDKTQMVFLSKKQVLNLFDNIFDIIEFEEIEKDEKTALGKIKHWHIYQLIAKKR